MTKRQLMTLYRRLYRSYGPQYWWPAETPFEVMVGAVLTQNTAWINVEKAVRQLKQAGKLDPDQIVGMRADRLASLIRPSGYFNIKARRLQNLCRWYVHAGGHTGLESLLTEALRDSLLSVNGVGPETADDILLYAFDRPVFVIDAYTRRLLGGLGLIEGTEPYEDLRAAFESRLDSDTALFNEYHALIVRHAKEPCDGTSACRHCKIERKL
ncbi:MAG: endonuclease III domain-containing protein [Gammaproteobacteria bacterium]